MNEMFRKIRVKKWGLGRQNNWIMETKLYLTIEWEGLMKTKNRKILFTESYFLGFFNVSWVCIFSTDGFIRVQLLFLVSSFFFFIVSSSAKPDPHYLNWSKLKINELVKSKTGAHQMDKSG